MLKQIELPNFSRVAAGASVTNEISTGPTFHRLFYSITSVLGGLDVTDVESVEVYADGSIIQRYSSLQRLLDHNTYYAHAGDSVGANEIVFGLHFFRGEFEERWRRLGGIGTYDLARFHVEIKMADAAPADIKFKAHADIDPAPMPIGAYFKVTEYPTAAEVAGDWNEIDKLPKRALMTAMHFAKSDVVAVDIEADQVKLMKGTKATMGLRSKNASPRARVPVDARMTHVDFCVNGDLADAIDLSAVGEFRVMYKPTATGALTIILETLDSLSEKAA